MTENEAIEILSNFDMQVSAKADGAYQSTIGEMACKVAVKALEEVQQYHSIGTVEECRAAVERQRAKKPTGIYLSSITGIHHGTCPDCGKTICANLENEEHSRYCNYCGKAVDWSDAEWNSQPTQRNG